MRHIAWCLLIVAFARPSAAMEPGSFGALRVDELEYGFGDGGVPIGWDASAWYGGDWNRVRVAVEGEALFDADALSADALDGEARLLYSRLIAAYWELHVGLRGDLALDGDDRQMRGLVQLSLDGVAPYWFEVEPAVFVSHLGDVSARLEVSHELYVTQRTVLESNVELDAAVQSVRAFGAGAGLNHVEAGLRLRYEFAREFAPYLGVSWGRALFEAVEWRREAGESPSELRGLVGLRAWL